jgi:hypothetical protein
MSFFALANAYARKELALFGFGNAPRLTSARIDVSTEAISYF